MTSVRSLWERLRTQGRPVDGFVRLRLPRIQAVAIYAARRLPDGNECLLLDISNDSLPASDGYPDCAGFRVWADVIEHGRGGSTRLILELVEVRYRDVFSALAEDIVATLAEESAESKGVAAMLRRLTRWQAFMRRHGSQGLSLEERRGLYGELKFMAEHVLPGGAATAVSSWKGGEAGCHDFQLHRASVEVKTTSAVTPHSIRISNVSQLEPEGAELWLCLIVVSEHVTAVESLPELVTSVRSQLLPPEADAFTLKLLEAGYLDAQADLYDEPRYTLRGKRVFRVSDEFPRIARDAVPDGVEDVAFSVSIAACLPHEETMGSLLSLLSNDDYDDPYR